LVERVAPHRELLWSTALGPFPPLAPAARLAGALRMDAARLAAMLTTGAGGMGRRLFGDDRAAAWLAGSLSHGDVGLRSPAGAMLAFGLAMMGQLVGWQFPRGGAGRLADALAEHVRELGGTVRCGATVETIELRGGRVAGVRLRGGEQVPAQAVVATVGPRPLLALLPPGAFDRLLERRLRRWRYGLGTFKLDLALAGPVPWTNAEAGQAGVVHLADTIADLAAGHREASAGRVPDRPVMVVGQHTLHDPTRAPEGRHTLYVYARVPQEPDAPDDEIAERMERRIEQFAPGFRDLILARRTRSPAQLAEHDPALVGGDLAAGSVRLSQIGPLRPSLRLYRGRTPLRGLYVAGGSVYPGPGVNGASGDAAARAVLSDAS
jgi:phytoene dehydrogenase-like protein